MTSSSKSSATCRSRSCSTRQPARARPASWPAGSPTSWKQRRRRPADTLPDLHQPGLQRTEKPHHRHGPRKGPGCRRQEIHSFCYSLIKEETKRQSDRYNDFLLYDDEDCRQIIDSCLRRRQPRATTPRHCRTSSNSGRNSASSRTSTISRHPKTPSRPGSATTATPWSSNTMPSWTTTTLSTSRTSSPALRFPQRRRLLPALAGPLPLHRRRRNAGHERSRIRRHQPPLPGPQHSPLRRLLPDHLRMARFLSGIYSGTIPQDLPSPGNHLYDQLPATQLLLKPPKAA